MTAAPPLAGLKIVVTRPRDQAGELVRAIELAGGISFLFPLLEISPLPDPAPLERLASRLHEFDLAVFISPNAVHYGMAAIHAAGPLPGALKFATVGQGSAAALRRAGIADVIAPKDGSDSESLLALPELQEVRGRRVVIFRGENGRELLGDTLKARGAHIEYAACYRRAKAGQDIHALLDAHADALTVTSSEALTYLWGMLDEPARTQLCALPLFVPHERIAAAARGLGWREVVATAGGDAGLVSGLLAWAGSGNRGGRGLRS